MIHSVSNNLANWINTYEPRDALELKKMTLGIEIFMINVSKIFVIITVSAVSGVLLQTLITVFAYALLRRYAFGLHSKTSTGCTVASILMFVAIPYLLTQFEINNYIVVSAFIFILLFLLKNAPADTSKRPIIGRKNRDLLRVKSFVVGIFLFFCALLISTGSIKLLIVVGASYEVLMISPLTYKILKRSRDNYEKYE